MSRTYPKETSFDEKGWKPIHITSTEVAQLGKIEDVLEKFLREQQEILQQRINEQYKETQEDVVKKILDAFVSEEGTKRPVAYSWQGEKLILEKRWAELFQPIRPEVLGACCRYLEQARLIRFEEKHIELAHDSLAALIDSQRSAQQRRLNDVRNRLRSQFNAFADTQEYLSRPSLNPIEELMPQLAPGLSSELKQFIEKSREYNDGLEKSELQRARRIATLGFSLAGVALLGLSLALFFFRQSNLEHIKTLKAIINTQLETARALKLEGKYPEAIALLEESRPLAQSDQLTEIQQLKNSWSRAGQYVASGDSLFLLNQVLAALDRYQEAQKISPDERMGRFIKEKTEGEYKRLMLNAGAMENARQWEFALKNYEDALHLKPDDSVVKERIRALKK
jgi:tetratricopeptide (TPR) repeat protein